MPEKKLKGCDRLFSYTTKIKDKEENVSPFWVKKFL